MNANAAPPAPQSPKPPDHVILRAARITDSDAIAALSELPGYRAGTLRLPFQNPERTRTWLESRNPENVLIVAERHGRIVGTAGLDRFQGRRAHAAGLGMGVHDDHTGRGIGRRLLAALLDTADNWLALSRVELTVYCDNAPALRLYERAGFEREGVLRRFAFRHGGFVDAFAMARLKP